MKKELKRKARPPGRADPFGKKIQGKKALRSGRSGSKRKQKNSLSGMLTKISGMVKEKLQTVNVRKVLITNIPYFIVFYLVEKEAWLYRHCTGDSMVKKLMNVFLYFGGVTRSLQCNYLKNRCEFPREVRNCAEQSIQ